MGLSMHVVGYKPADTTWKKMKAAWDACALAGVSPPSAVCDFFGGEDPGDAPGKEVEIEGESAKNWRDDGREGFEVDIDALPDGVRFIRFFCSY